MNETKKLKKAKRIIIILSAILAILLILLLCLRSCNRSAEDEPSSSRGNYIIVPETLPSPSSTPTPTAEVSPTPTPSPAPAVTPDYSTPVPQTVTVPKTPSPTPTATPGFSYDTGEGTEDSYTSFTLYKRHEEDGEPFSVSNMFPGDSVTKRYTLKTSFIDYLTVNFKVAVRDGYEKLAEVLKLRIVNVDTGETVYDGDLKDLNEVFTDTLTSEIAVEETITYDITLSLGTDVGNEYMSLPLVADIRWWTEDTDNLVILHKGRPGGDTPEWIHKLIPGTGDSAHPLLWSFVILGTGVAAVLVLTAAQRRKRRAEK